MSKILSVGAWVVIVILIITLIAVNVGSTYENQRPHYELIGKAECAKKSMLYIDTVKKDIWETICYTDSPFKVYRFTIGD